MKNVLKKIIVAEPSPVVSAGLKTMLGGLFEVVAVVDTIQALRERMVQTRPDLVLLNPLMVDYSVRMQLHTLFDSDCVLVAIETVLLGQKVLGQYKSVISLADDQRTIESKLKKALSIEAADRDDANGNYELSARELEVLKLVAKGFMNKEIADKLNISIHTVISHRKNITHKTGIKTISGLTVYALLNNMIEE